MYAQWRYNKQMNTSNPDNRLSKPSAESILENNPFKREKGKITAYQNHQQKEEDFLTPKHFLEKVMQQPH